MNILIIEDNIDLAENLKTQFEITGYNNVDICINGYCAMNYVQNKKYDVLVLDIILPNIDGLDILEKLKSENSINKNTFVIMSTGLSSDKVLTKAQILGADYYITKPYSFSTLLSAVNISKKINDDSTEVYVDIKLKDFAENYLLDSGISEHLKGFYLLKKAFIHIIESNYDETFRITKDIYPYLANLENVDAANVERNIRHAIGKSNYKNHTNLAFLLKMFKSYYKNNSLKSYNQNNLSN